MQELSFDTFSDGKTIRIQLKGDLSFVQHGTFRRMLDGLPEELTDLAVELDLKQVPSIDAAGLGLLLLARDQVTVRGGAFTLVQAGGNVARIIELSGF